MACTLHTQTGGDIIANLSPDLVVPVADGNLLDFVSDWIWANIPDRAPVASAIGVQQQLLAQQHQLTTLLVNQQATAVAAALPRLKTVAEVYPAFVGSLLKYCHVDREELLPPVYSRMANSKCHAQVAVIKYALAARADEIGWAPPVVSPEVVQMIYKMQFTAPDMDDITAGLSMFLMVGSNEAKAGGVRARQNVFSMVNAGNVAPNMDQLNRLVDNVPQMARDLVSLLTILRAYSILLDVVLGTHHVLAASYRGFVLRWDQQAQPTINSCFTAAEIPALMPLVQCRLQLETQYWLNQISMTATEILPQVPDYSAILRDVALRLWNTFQAIPAWYTVTPPTLPPLLPVQNEGGFPPVIAPPLIN